ncbi:XRE family transcriptional regulator [Methylobacterium oryzae]|uniref:XRE family transcriptional regulator n=1 Tax=Methylobacterium oryzae TaxID=334852 RepID=UPI001F413563|nr:XRE family transcriptional regulator [Methylobacterium oryzae]UIN36919.1 XRE family transcriptional regulator [Methylobacterium oryzae]
MTSAPAGTRLKALREQRNMSQEELSRVLGFDHRQTLQQIESGQRRLTAGELVAAVEAFGLPLDYFTNPYLIVGEARFSWRRDADTSVANLDAFERKAGEWIGAYRELRTAMGRPVSPIVHRLNLTRASSYEDATDAGEAVAQFLDLGPIPSRTLARAMYERMSILVLMVDATVGISGAACLVRNLGAVLVNRGEAPGRRSYDLAHELFHILTWDAMPPERLDDGEGTGKLQKRVETMAEKFASAVLMPAQILNGIPMDAADPAWLNATATELGVSSKALKWRLVDLGRLDRSVARAFDDDLLVNNGGLLARGMDAPLPFGRPFIEVMADGIGQGRVSVGRVAAMLEVTVEGLGELFDAHGVARTFDI